MDFFPVCLYPFACFQIVVGESSNSVADHQGRQLYLLPPKAQFARNRSGPCTAQSTGHAGKALWRDLFSKAPKGNAPVELNCFFTASHLRVVNTVCE